jgi:large subunit ribosomal protein L32
MPAIATCDKCGAVVLPHNACGDCGYYKGRKIDHTVKDEQQAAER